MGRQNFVKKQKKIKTTRLEQECPLKDNGTVPPPPDFFLMSLQNLPALCDGKEKKSTGRSASRLNLRRKAEGAAASYSAIVVCMRGKKSRLSCCKSSTFGNARTLLHILHMHRLFKTLIISFAPCMHTLYTLIGWAVFTVEMVCSKAVWHVCWLCAMLQKQSFAIIKIIKHVCEANWEL